MTAAQATGQHRNFNARFKTYLTRNLAYLYRLVTTVEGPLSEDLRHQVTHTLTYGLAVDANWPVARDLLLATASDMELAGYREDWLPFLQQGVTQGLHLHDLAAVAECRLQIGMIYRMVSEFDLAHQELQKSIAGFATVEAAHDQARALNELAWLE
ncbi:MAG: hypothetical protein KDE19_15885, partial [Caldilineaceae bacterium]|nr:hypothetical protein [Caldilineaceae bacterium]